MQKSNQPDKQTQEKIQRLQAIEQQIQSLLMQKQSFQLELDETENALQEVEKTKEGVYKLLGQVLLKASKPEVEKELNQKKDILSLRTKTIEKQEQNLNQEKEKLRKQVMDKIK
jgi:prefoldin beta subunit